ncbi:MAG TPA: DciA family protein [Gaiellaceae bacterium]|nr:DciA family protein [Gaiellaceae bacterium]
MPELLERWPAAVGPAIAQNAWPARIAKDGTVHVHTADSVWAFELAQRAGEIAGRLGVDKLRFAPGPLPEAAEERARPPLEPTVADDARARELAAGIDDETLRETVQKAVRLSLARERRDRPI